MPFSLSSTSCLLKLPIVDKSTVLVSIKKVLKTLTVNAICTKEYADRVTLIRIFLTLDKNCAMERCDKYYSKCRQR